MAHIITALTPQKRNRRRVSVYLDGEFAFGLERIVAAWLQVGQEISEEKIAQLQAEDGREVAYQQALNLLSYRSHSENEVIQNLREHGVPDESIEYTVSRLKDNRLLDDHHFAQAWVENRNEMRPRSRRALAYELRQRGVDQETIEQSLEAVDDQKLAYLAASKKARKFRNSDWKDFRQKMYRFLSQRGFDYEAISQATTRVWAEVHGDDRPLDEDEEATL